MTIEFDADAHSTCVSSTLTMQQVFQSCSKINAYPLPRGMLPLLDRKRTNVDGCILSVQDDGHLLLVTIMKPLRTVLFQSSTMSKYRGTVASLLCLISFAWIEPISGLSAAPPSNNPDVLRSYVFGETTEARCWEVLSSESSSNPEDEDEVEYWYPTRKRHFEFSVPNSSVASQSPTTIRQTSFGCGKLGSEIWDSSVALCLYLGLQADALTTGKNILELGAGCGLPSVVCRDELRASSVLATDFWEKENDGFDEDRLVPTKYHGLNLEHNVATAASVARVQCLDWHDRESAILARDSFQPDLIIGSDLVYYPMDVEPLLNVLEILLKESQTRAALALPLAPANREALPEFREKVQVRFAQTHSVTLKELDLHREDTEGEDSVHLFVEIVPK